jgi:hypothetical protein
VGTTIITTPYRRSDASGGIIIHLVLVLVVFVEISPQFGHFVTGLLLFTQVREQVIAPCLGSSVDNKVTNQAAEDTTYAGVCMRFEKDHLDFHLPGFNLCPVHANLSEVPVEGPTLRLAYLASSASRVPSAVFGCPHTAILCFVVLCQACV